MKKHSSGSFIFYLLGNYKKIGNAIIGVLALILIPLAYHHNFSKERKALEEPISPETCLNIPLEYEDIYYDEEKKEVVIITYEQVVASDGRNTIRIPQDSPDIFLILNESKTDIETFLVLAHIDCIDLYLEESIFEVRLTSNEEKIPIKYLGKLMEKYGESECVNNNKKSENNIICNCT